MPCNGGGPGSRAIVTNCRNVYSVTYGRLMRFKGPIRASRPSLLSRQQPN